MTLREELERQEHEHLDPKAAFADESRGRLHPEEAFHYLTHTYNYLLNYRHLHKCKKEYCHVRKQLY